MDNIDHYLLHEFRILDKGRIPESTDAQSQQPLLRLPMLLRVKGVRWSPGKTPDCSVIARLGNIVACVGSRRTLEALRNDPNVVSIEASRSVFSPECKYSLPRVKANVVHQQPLAEKGDKALIAIIDSNIDILHYAFRDSTGKQTRIVALWDQTDPTGPAPNLARPHQPVGTVYSQSQINSYIANPKSLPTGLAYQRAIDGHGTHVASIAAGRAISQSQFPGGVAPEAKLVIVIPAMKINKNDPLSLGYSTSHTAALAFIEKITEKHKLPVVVNLSQGMNAGAHDGTSLVEAAFDDFTGGGRAPGRVVVKSAGNERGEHCGHARVRITSNQQEMLHWFSPPPQENHIEGIYKDTIELWFQACDQLEFRLRNPRGQYSRRVSWASPADSGCFLNGSNYELSYVRYHWDNGVSRLLINIHSEENITTGKWTLEIKSNVVLSIGDIHAWIERQAKRSIWFTNHINEEMTLTIPGTAHTVISVGSVGFKDALYVAPYSSYGPTRDNRHKPELVAPGERINAAKGKSLVDLVEMCGTSMAAPHVTGAIALLFSYWEKRGHGLNWTQLNAAQIRAAVSQLTQDFHAFWNNGMGYGLLDIEKLLDAFD